MTDADRDATARFCFSSVTHRLTVLEERSVNGGKTISMLALHPIDVMLTATDLGAARQFYGDRIGLDVLIESDEFVTFRCGGDSRLM